MDNKEILAGLRSLVGLWEEIDQSITAYYPHLSRDAQNELVGRVMSFWIKEVPKPAN